MKFSTAVQDGYWEDRGARNGESADPLKSAIEDFADEIQGVHFEPFPFDDPWQTDKVDLNKPPF